MEQSKIIFAISMLNGGGAERVLLQLIDELNNRGWESLLLVTNQHQNNAKLEGVPDGEEMRFCLDEIEVPDPAKSPLRFANIICRCCEKTGKAVPAYAARISFVNLYRTHIKWLRSILLENPNCPMIAFLHPTDQITLMAAENLPNPIILSDRSDPKKYFKSRYAHFFLEHYFNTVSAIVFQTPYAMECYPPSIREKGVIISNPLSKELPKRYLGEREKVIVNFCRITPEKNIKLLIDSFCMFHKLHFDYRLEIIGDGPAKKELVQYTKEIGMEDYISFLDFLPDVHARIEKYAMYVSSSDWEGLSNSMLEAMAIGLPTICTDCGGGGARYVIQDHVNGLLIPVSNAEALCKAMKELADDVRLRDRLSASATKLRETFSLERIIDRWERIIYNSLKQPEQK